MKKIALLVAITGILAAQVCQAGNVSVGINVGTPTPVYMDAGPQPVTITEPVEFIFAPGLGFYVAVGVPYDIVFVSNYYYLHRGNHWYRAPYYNGPWVVTGYNRLPPGLRKHRFERIRTIRDREYRIYREDPSRYKGKHFRPDKEWKHERKEERKEMKQERKEERKEIKQDRKEDRREMKQDKKMEKEERKHGGGN
jgi:hypothetical protein